MTLLRPWISSRLTSTRCLLAVASMAAALSLFASSLGAGAAHAQADSTAASTTPALYSEWSAGLQASPLFGVSVRYNATRRLAFQAAGLPGFWGGAVRGVIGGRALYRLSVQEGYNLFVAGGTSVLFDEQAQFQNGLDVEKQVETIPSVNSSFGIETDVGDHIGLSVEAGGAYVFDGDESYLLPAVGVGIHYYW